MITLRNSTRTRRLAVNTALAAALVAGCAGIGSLALAESGPKGSDKAAKMVAGAEDAVRKSPQDAALRAALGRAYLAAGRFESAADAFGEAAELGDSSASVALSFALAQIGEGRLNDAIATLGQNRDQIPAGDYGLALALAGETSRGVAVLEDALRAGENTPKLRQNLAYAYALDGRWRGAHGRFAGRAAGAGRRPDERVGRAGPPRGLPRPRRLVAGRAGARRHRPARGACPDAGRQRAAARRRPGPATTA